MQKAQTIESPTAAKTRVTDRLQSEFYDKCIAFHNGENTKLLNQILKDFEKNMRTALEDVSSSKIDNAVNIATTLGKSTLLNLDPCKMNYNNFKALKKNTCGENGGDCAINSSDYAELSKQFQNRAKDIFLENFLHEISEIAKNFKNDIKLLEQKKQSEQDGLEQEEKAKDEKAMSDLSGLDNIFTNRIGRGFFKLFGGGKPSLQNILTEIGLKDINPNIVINEAKPKLIEKFKDAKTAELAFTTACQNKFDREVFNIMEAINNARFEAINKSENLLRKNTELEKENQEMKKEIEEYKKQFEEIQKISAENFTKDRIDIILNKPKVLQEHNAYVISEKESLMKEFSDSILNVKKAMTAELAKESNNLTEALAKRKERKQQVQKQNVPPEQKVNDNRPQSSGSNRSHAQNQIDFYKQDNSPRPRSSKSISANVEHSRSRINGSQSQGSPRLKQ